MESNSRPRFYSKSEFKRLRSTGGAEYWVDEKAPANGIGPVCRFCKLLIDSPSDHADDCATRND